MDGLRAIFVNPAIRDIAVSIATDFPAAIDRLHQIGVILSGDATNGDAKPAISAPKALPVVVVPSSLPGGFTTLKQRSFVTPRGKFDVEFVENGVRLQGKDAGIEVSAHDRKNLRRT